MGELARVCAVLANGPLELETIAERLAADRSEVVRWLLHAEFARLVRRLPGDRFELWEAEV